MSSLPKPHHIRREFCRTRKAYRDGREPKAVKVIKSFELCSGRTGHSFSHWKFAAICPATLYAFRGHAGHTVECFFLSPNSDLYMKRQ
jgi:hypothetical protein